MLVLHAGVAAVAETDPMLRCVGCLILIQFFQRFKRSTSLGPASRHPKPVPPVPPAAYPPMGPPQPQATPKAQAPSSLQAAAAAGSSNEPVPMDEDKMKSNKRGHEETKVETTEEPKKHFVTEKDPVSVLPKLPEDTQERVKALPVSEQSEATRVELESIYQSLAEEHRLEVVKKSTLQQRVDVMLMYRDLQDAEKRGDL